MAHQFQRWTDFVLIKLCTYNAVHVYAVGGGRYPGQYFFYPILYPGQHFFLSNSISKSIFFILIF